MKAIMPRLGQPIQTPSGPGMVVSMQLLKESVTVRLEEDGREELFPAAMLGFGSPKPFEAPIQSSVAAPVTHPVDVDSSPAPRAVQIDASPTPEPAQQDDAQSADDEAGEAAEDRPSKSRNRRRRRRGNRGPGAAQS
jgi:hypothetical protein